MKIVASKDVEVELSDEQVEVVVQNSNCTPELYADKLHESYTKKIGVFIAPFVGVRIVRDDWVATHTYAGSSETWDRVLRPVTPNERIAFEAIVHAQNAITQYEKPAGEPNA